MSCKRDRADHYCRVCFLTSEVVNSLEFQKELENPYLISGKGRNSAATRIISKKNVLCKAITPVYCYRMNIIIQTMAFYLSNFCSFDCTEVNQALPKFIHVICVSRTDKIPHIYTKMRNLHLVNDHITVNTNPQLSNQ